MNTNLVKVFVAFAAGVGVGVIGAHFYFKNKMEEEIEAVIERLHTEHLNHRPLEPVEIRDEEGNILPPTDPEFNEKYDNLRDAIKKTYGSDEKREPISKKNLLYRKQENEQKTAYNLLSKQNVSDEDDPAFEVLRGVIHIISFIEFNEECDDYEKLSMCYYDVDETLCDDQEVIVVDVETLIGGEALYRFETSGNGANDVVYVRNDNLKTDYEIIRLHSSYMETVTGIPNAKVNKRRKKTNADA